MLNEDLIRSLQEEREREIEARLRVRRFLPVRRPVGRWLHSLRSARRREAVR
jgi:hypothetical protein